MAVVTQELRPKRTSNGTFTCTSTVQLLLPEDSKRSLLLGINNGDETFYYSNKNIPVLTMDNGIPVFPGGFFRERNLAIYVISVNDVNIRWKAEFDKL